MFAVIRHNGGRIYQITDDGISAGEAVQKIINDNQLEIRGTWTLQDTHDGHTVSESEILITGRIYNLNAWFTAR